MKKKKILYLITKSSWGGAQRYVFDLATNLDPKQYEPVIAVGGHGELYERLREAGLKVVSINGLERDVSLIGDLRASWHLLSILRKEKPDVLHVNSSKVGVLGTLFGRVLRIPKIIFTSHGWAFNEDRAAWQKLIIKALQWLTVLLSHTTIVVSSGVRNDMNWPLVAPKMHVVHLGRHVSDLKSRQDAREILSMKVSGESGSLYEHINDQWIGTIAELHPTKCVHITISAMAELVTDFSNLRYIVIHDGDERHRLEKLIKNLNLEQHVFLLGTIPDAARLLPAFDLFVLPSQSEAFGYVLLEAGQAELPVVASNVGGIPDIIDDNKTGLLVPPKDVPAITAAMKKILTNDTLRKHIASAHQTRSATFTIEKMLTETTALY